MNVNNYKDLDLIKYTTILSFLISFNYFLWSINSWEIIKSINLGNTPTTPHYYINIPHKYARKKKKNL